MPGTDFYRLPDLPERAELEPFATIFVDVIVPEAVSGGWFESVRNVPDEDLERITRRIEAAIATSLGRALHSAIYVHALLVCAHYFYKAVESADLTESEEDPLPAVESGFALAQSLVLYHNLYELYLKVSV